MDFEKFVKGNNQQHRKSSFNRYAEQEQRALFFAPTPKSRTLFNWLRPPNDVEISGNLKPFLKVVK